MSGVSTDPRQRRLFVEALGCKVSRVDACATAAPFARAAAPAGADVVLLHGCAVTERALRDGRRAVRRLRRQSPDATLVVSGCLAEDAARGLAAMPEVDLVVPLAARAGLGALLDARDAGLLPGKIAGDDGTRGAALFAMPAEGRAASAFLDAGRTRAFLKIQDGCRRRCAFCIVPKLRGAERSASRADVANAVRALGASGVPEVVLTGIHLAAFGGSERGGGALLALLDDLERDVPRCRVRLSSLEPMEAGVELAARVAASRVVVPHLHLPLQSGSASVLRRMRRGIVPSRYRALARAAVRANPRLHLATDLIAGFPGETDAEFEETLRFVEELPFASLHVFPFSPRAGTDAAAWHRDEAVPARKVTERTRALRRLGDAKAAGFAARASGTVADLVVLGGGRGLTDHYLEVGLRLPDADAAPGRRLAVRLAASPEDGTLEAHPC
ncbi:MAG TPA: MiaB/RimO family radical SAM methylthiotransferase [Thermoanaerobaculia bacterium]|jgi:threonylcarbamoyladenosine tRNA methylthiotransferase MtaB